MTRAKTTIAIAQVLTRALNDEINQVERKIPWDPSGMYWIQSAFARHASAQGLADVKHFAWDPDGSLPKEQTLSRVSAGALGGSIELRYINQSRTINVVAVTGQQPQQEEKS